MKKLLFGLIATVMFGFVGNAQDGYLKLSSELSNKVKNPIKIYLGENSTVLTSENQSKMSKYLLDFNSGTLDFKNLDVKELKGKYDELNTQYSKDETYLLMQNIIKTSSSPQEVLSKIENDLVNNRIPKDKINQFILWHYSIQIADYNNVFDNNVNGRAAGPCWAGIVGSAGLGAIAGAGLGGIPTAGIGAAPGAIIGGICGALVGWSNC